MLGSGSVSDMMWARPALAILGIDCPPVIGSTAATVPRASARLKLRIPPEPAQAGRVDSLIGHLREAAPWGVEVTGTPRLGSPFRANNGWSGVRADALGDEEAAAHENSRTA